MEKHEQEEHGNDEPPISRAHGFLPYCVDRSLMDSSLGRFNPRVRHLPKLKLGLLDLEIFQQAQELYRSLRLDTFRRFFVQVEGQSLPLSPLIHELDRSEVSQRGENAPVYVHAVEKQSCTQKVVPSTRVRGLTSSRSCAMIDTTDQVPPP